MPTQGELNKIIRESAEKFRVAVDTAVMNTTDETIEKLEAALVGVFGEETDSATICATLAMYILSMCEHNGVEPAYFAMVFDYLRTVTAEVKGKTNG